VNAFIAANNDPTGATPGPHREFDSQHSARRRLGQHLWRRCLHDAAVIYGRPRRQPTSNLMVPVSAGY
jgi:hypothetical protein